MELTFEKSKETIDKFKEVCYNDFFWKIWGTLQLSSGEGPHCKSEGVPPPYTLSCNEDSLYYRHTSPTYQKN